MCFQDKKKTIVGLHKVLTFTVSDAAAVRDLERDRKRQ